MIDKGQTLVLQFNDQQFEVISLANWPHAYLTNKKEYFCKKYESISPPPPVTWPNYVEKDLFVRESNFFSISRK